MKHTLAGTVFTIAMGVAPMASAQSHDFSRQNQHSVEMTAGFNFTMPLGQQRSGKVEDKARMGFRLGLTESYDSRFRSTSHHRSVDMLEIGLRLDGAPSLLLSGQDIYTPLFTTLSADEGDTTSGGTDKRAGSAIAIVAVTAAVLVGGAALLANEIEDDIEDAFR